MVEFRETGEIKQSVYDAMNKAYLTAMKQLGEASRITDKLKAKVGKLKTTLVEVFCSCMRACARRINQECRDGVLASGGVEGARVDTHVYQKKMKDIADGMMELTLENDVPL